MHAVALCDDGLGDAAGELGTHLVEIGHHPGDLRGHAARASETLACGFLCGEGLPGALRDEIALYLCGQSEGEGYYLGIDAVGELEVVIDGVDADAAPGAEVEY